MSQRLARAEVATKTMLEDEMSALESEGELHHVVELEKVVGVLGELSDVRLIGRNSNRLEREKSKVDVLLEKRSNLEVKLKSLV